jgi:RNA polymerase sigma-70 factor (ECF subfamily)
VAYENLAEPSGALKRLEEVFRLCSPQLHRYIRRRLRRPADAQDLTQEVFERFLRGDWRAKIRDPQAYLFGIASHVVADARIAEHRSPITYDSETFGEVSESVAALDKADSLVFVEELEHAMAHLPAAHRVALLLTKRDGLTCKEAALKMSSTEGTVRLYVCEARAQLRALLRKR